MFAARLVGPLALVSAVLLPLAPAAARQEVAPDRPDITDSAQTISPGGFQLESGIEYGRTRIGGSPAERRLSLDTTLRIGLAERIELEVDAEPVVWLRTDREYLSRGDLTLLLKYRFFGSDDREAGLALALRPFVKLPTADAPIGSERTDFGLQLLLSQPLPADFSVDVNAGIAANGQRQPDGFLLQALASASLSYEVIPGLSPFVELFFQTKDQWEGRNLLGLTAGVVYLLNESVAVDTAVRTSLMGRGPDWSVTAGVSVRWGK